jgi:signal transduction histidine kinase
LTDNLIDGTGLGLYVARQMVEAHKGKIWAESKGEGMGSKFIFTIPIK